MRSLIAVALTIAASSFAVACGDDVEDGSTDESLPRVSDAGPIQVHGLGINPAAGELSRPHSVTTGFPDEPLSLDVATIPIEVRNGRRHGRERDREPGHGHEDRRAPPDRST
jgi:hypothetical protein